MKEKLWASLGQLRVFFLVPQSMAESFSTSFASDFEGEALVLAEFWVVGINVMHGSD